MRLTAAQRRALGDVAAGRVAQDRVARYYLDGQRAHHGRERSIRSVIFHRFATHRRSAVARKGQFIPIDLTEAGLAKLTDERGVS